ncbi:MAG: hypothetical protein ACLFSQ_12530 [Candidatus Zixiibacteriota bacterium]
MKGKKCFQHILVSIDELNVPIFIQTRPGNKYTNYKATEIIEEVLARFSPLVDNILVRSDSGFYFTKFLQNCDKYQNFGYIVKAKYLKNIIEIAYKRVLKAIITALKSMRFVNML